MDETYPTRGNHRLARNHFSDWQFPVVHADSGKRYVLQFRLYDDGVAYRYVMRGTGVQHVDGESSSWTLLAGAKTWYFERLTKGWKLKSYAGEWMSTDIGALETATPADVGPVQGTPLVLELPGGLGYAAVTKAATYNYSGMRLRAIGDRTVVADFAEGADGFDVDGAIETPWRVTLLADDLNDLVNSDLIDFEIAALRSAAERRLMINFHGCHASTGEERTWPNEMTREGIRGIELNKMKEGPLTASHNAALPFTRYVVGHADYTPVLCTNGPPRFRSRWKTGQ